jgi:ADP-ribosyl-[dinitrogen reductase] hydrolase
MISDDTEHTWMVAQALLAHPDDPLAFQRCLAGKLRLWLLGLPAGIGLATLRSILKLWVGISPTRSGVWSAGNGPAMRSALIGVHFAADPARRRAFVTASSQITHSDPKANVAALAIAEAAAWAVHPQEPLGAWLTQLPGLGDDAEWPRLMQRLSEALSQGESVEAYAESLGLGRGVTGYAYHSVPVALYAWLRHPGDFRQALESALNCGGDTDTVGAMVGALAGAQVGVEGIPPEWLAGIWEWPRTPSLMTRLAERLAQAGKGTGPVRYFWPGLLPRNLLLMGIVLLHGLRRLGPPY